MEGFGELARLTGEVWETSFFGLDIGRLVLAVGLFLLFYILRGLASRTLIVFVGRFVERTETQIDDYLFKTLSAPLRLVFVITGLFFAIEVLSITGLVADIAEKILRSLIAGCIFWMLYNAVGLLSLGLGKLEEVLATEIVSWGMKALRIGVLVLAGAAILQIWGIEIAPLIAGLGLFGLAVALGAQDIFKNLLGGLSILIERRFSKGDWIRVNGIVEGTVASIGLRSTKITRFDKAPVFVPNAAFSDNAVINFSAMSHRRIYWTIGLDYRTSVPQLRAIRDQIEACIREDEAFAHPPEVSLFVHVDSFDESAISLMLYCFTKTTNWGAWLAIKEKLAWRIKEIVEEAGSGFAFPSRSIYIETPADRPETFTPPTP